MLLQMFVSHWIIYSVILLAFIWFFLYPVITKAGEILFMLMIASAFLGRTTTRRHRKEFSLSVLGAQILVFSAVGWIVYHFVRLWLFH
jgi:hypothetical protein